MFAWCCTAVTVCKNVNSNSPSVSLHYRPGMLQLERQIGQHPVVWGSSNISCLPSSRGPLQLSNRCLPRSQSSNRTDNKFHPCASLFPRRSAAVQHFPVLKSVGTGGGGGSYHVSKYSSCVWVVTRAADRRRREVPNDSLGRAPFSICPGPWGCPSNFQSVDSSQSRGVLWSLHLTPTPPPDHYWTACLQWVPVPGCLGGL